MAHYNGKARGIFLGSLDWAKKQSGYKPCLLGSVTRSRFKKATKWLLIFTFELFGHLSTFCSPPPPLPSGFIECFMGRLGQLYPPQNLTSWPSLGGLYRAPPAPFTQQPRTLEAPGQLPSRNPDILRTC